MAKGFFSRGTPTFSRGFSAGFTVIELLVSMGIMATIMGTVIINYPESSLRINLAILTHETALAIREAQLKGTAVDSKDLSVGGYGTFFSIASTTEYASFADIATDPGLNGLPVGDGIYSTLAGADETLSVTQFPKRFTISKLCVGKGYPFNGTNSGSCNNDLASTLPKIDTVTIAFIRPNPRPVITINQNTGTEQGGLTGACIELVTPKKAGPGNVRSVQAYASGRILTSEIGCQ